METTLNKAEIVARAKRALRSSQQQLANAQQQVITPAGTDISQVDPDTSVVPDFTLSAPTTLPPLTLTLESQTSETSSALPQAREIDRVTEEIRTLESQMANRENERALGFETAGIWDDMRRLNELNASLRQAQDRKIEIPVEVRQQLRGRGATTTEFNQMTTPQLENAALQELTASRASSRLTDSINLNLAQVNQVTDAKIAEDKIFYQQKNSYLTALQTSYGNIVSAEQSFRLEIAKSTNDSLQKQSEAQAKVLQQQMDIAIERGDFSGAQRMYETQNIDTAFEINQSNSDKITQEGETRKADVAIGVVTTINAILNSKGLKGLVGPNPFARISYKPGAVTDLSTKIDNFTSVETLQTLLDLKAEGGTLGALSETELEILQNAAVAITRNKDGTVKMTEAGFREVMNAMKTASQKVYLASNGYNGATVKEMDSSVVNALYEAKRNEVKERVNDTNFFDSEIRGTVSSVIREFEDFSSTAYPDAGGWAIGFGSQTHSDGTPVRQGDVINRQQAEQNLASSIQKHSNWRQYVTANLNPNQQAAIASFEFNHGPAIWRNDQTAREILELINRGDRQGAGQLMQQFVYAYDPRVDGKVVNPALVRRRLTEAQLLNTV